MYRSNLDIGLIDANMIGMNESPIKPRNDQALYEKSNTYYGKGYDYIEVGSHQDVLFLPPEFKPLIERDLDSYYPAVRRALVWSNRWHRLSSWFRSIPVRIRGWFRKKPHSPEPATYVSFRHFWNLPYQIRSGLNRVGKCYKQFDLYGNHALMYSSEELAEHKRYQQYVTIYDMICKEDYQRDSSGLTGVLSSFPGALLDGLPALDKLINDGRRKGTPDEINTWKTQVTDQLLETEAHFDAALAAFYEQKNELSEGTKVRDIIRENNSHNRSYRTIQNVATFAGVQSLYIPFTVSRELNYLPQDTPAPTLASKIEEAHEQYLKDVDSFFREWVKSR